MTESGVGGRCRYVVRGRSIRSKSDERDVLGTVVEGSLLADGNVDVTGEGRLVVAWSGTLGDELFEPHPMNWMAAGRAALDAVCDRLRPRLEEAGRVLCLHPHARHVLSDVPSCRSFLEQRRGQPFAIALAPASMLEPGMLGDIEDHLRRIVESLADRCSMVILADVVPSDDGTSCRRVPLGEGLLPQPLLGELLATVPQDLPFVLDPSPP